MKHNQNIGQRGEDIAAKYLWRKKYILLERNFHSHWGEIDIIAKKAGKIIFLEVKTRLNDDFGKPYEAVNPAKIKKLNRPIQYFLLKNNYKNYKLSLDVISIILNQDLTVKNLKHFENVSIGKV